MKNRAERKRKVRSPLGIALTKIYGGVNPRTIVLSMATDLIYASRLPGPPFSPFEYARSLGLIIEYADIKAEGVFVAESGTPRLRAVARENAGENLSIGELPAGFGELKAGKRIVLRAGFRGSAQRRRLNFTLAHEIGHFLIRHAVAGFLPTSAMETTESRRDEETFCNAIASQLLMPHWIVSEDFEKFGLDPEAIVLMSDRYNVSVQAVLCRAEELFGSGLVALIWKHSYGRVVVDWAVPRQFKNAILCDTGQTTVERAIASTIAECGRDSFLVSGKRTQWATVSQRLPQSSRILSIMLRPELRRIGRDVTCSGLKKAGPPVQLYLPI